MKIAVIGWGSLLWDPRTLELAAPFALGGPGVPIEFCRVSRDRRLTLIIDEDFGTICDTYAGVSAFGTLDEAVENLRVREGMRSGEDVGFVGVVTGARAARAVERHAHATETIAAWAAASGFEAVVWTALGGNFEAEVGEPFSVTAAMRFLEAQRENDAEAFGRSLAYIRRAPDATRTPVRERVEKEWPALEA